MIYNSIVGSIFCRLEGDTLTGLSIGVNNFQGIQDKTIHLELKKELDAYFNGQLFEFSFPIRFKSGTDFQLKIWHALMKIPYGETVTYKALAKAIGLEKGYQAVANAVGNNPILILVPCHRVIGSDGTLRGFSAGLKAKSWLIKHERRFRLSTNLRHWFE